VISVVDPNPVDPGVLIQYTRYFISRIQTNFNILSYLIIYYGIYLATSFFNAHKKVLMSGYDPDPAISVIKCPSGSGSERDKYQVST
jgi:hypothetical protein